MSAHAETFNTKSSYICLKDGHAACRPTFKCFQPYEQVSLIRLTSQQSAARYAEGGGHRAQPAMIVRGKGAKPN